MPARPTHHPLANLERDDPTPERSILPRAVATEAGSTASTRVLPTAGTGEVADPSDPSESPLREQSVFDLNDQDGSVATEYGLLAVVAATIVSVMLEWATSGGITSLMASIMARVASLVGL